VSRRSVWKNYRPLVKDNRATSANCRFEFKKRSQHFIGVHNETLSVAAMRQQSRLFGPLAFTGSR
jgi:hypothetical protein